ncbi:MAG TPA: PQQ-binding-like beta-propeller repeat protein [Tepidisphaeraceae bacterium]|jgi:outer membrane protein assembly factor BamB|nr:PQQ-binding-like beta-propeller repeat protein [Tepidisphaeraceae bacterium]
MTRFFQYLALSTFCACALIHSPAIASDWPQYRGPTHDGISTETLKLPWPAGGPKILWTAPTTNGFSSFSVGDGEAFTQVGREANGSPREFCIALDAATGKELWAVDVGESKYQGGGDSGAKNNKGGDGPRSTPVISDGKVYVLSSELVLDCLDAKSGKQVWTKDLVKDFGGKNITWKNAASPLIDGDLLYVAAGGAGESFIAFNKKSGAVAWKSGTEKITQATPVIGTILGVRQVVFFTQSGLVSVAPDSGKELWKYPFKYSTSTAASPVICGDIVYCAAGYNVGSGACKITKEGGGLAAVQIWRLTGNKPVANHWSTPVYNDGYLYGMFSFKEYGSGPLKCVEVATGKVMWEKAGFGAGQVILAGDKLLALTDDGQIVAVQATPTGYAEISRAQAVTGKCWSTPALSDGRLYVRSTKEGACLELNAK